MNFDKIPNHIAIIMDGNRRWAKERNLPSHKGHETGAKNIETIALASKNIGVKYLSLFTLSIENLKRSQDELDFIFKQIFHYLEIEKITHWCTDNQINIKCIGNTELLPQYLNDRINQVNEINTANAQLNLQLMICHSGKQDIIETVKKIISQDKQDTLTISEESFSNMMQTSELPDIDLLIRTGGEFRISNFMLWQAAYAELLFSEKMWPDFNQHDIQNAILDYQKRCRRYGI